MISTFIVQVYVTCIEKPPQHAYNNKMIYLLQNFFILKKVLLAGFTII